MKDIKLEVSARHVHLTQEDVEALFGKGHALTCKKELSQPGQFACEERVTVVGPKKTFENEDNFEKLVDELDTKYEAIYIPLYTVKSLRSGHISGK